MPQNDYFIARRVRVMEYILHHDNHRTMSQLHKGLNFDRSTIDNDVYAMLKSNMLTKTKTNNGNVISVVV